MKILITFCKILGPNGDLMRRDFGGHLQFECNLLSAMLPYNKTDDQTDWFGSILSEMGGWLIIRTFTLQGGGIYLKFLLTEQETAKTVNSMP